MGSNSRLGDTQTNTFIHIMNLNLPFIQILLVFKFFFVRFLIVPEPVSIRSRRTTLPLNNTCSVSLRSDTVAPFRQPVKTCMKLHMTKKRPNMPQCLAFRPQSPAVQILGVLFPIIFTSRYRKALLRDQARVGLAGYASYKVRSLRY